MASAIAFILTCVFLAFTVSCFWPYESQQERRQREENARWSELIRSDYED